MTATFADEPRQAGRDGSRPVAARAAVLIGPPGSGKTTVGRALAKLWGADFRDTDHDVEAGAGKSVADIFLEDGEPAFRALERDAVLAALADLAEGNKPLVVALGGGAPLHPDVQSALANAPVVFLDVSLAAAAPRVGLTGARPLLAVNPRATWQRLYAERRPTYERLATITLATDETSPEQLAAQVDEQLAAATAAAARDAVTIGVAGSPPYDVRIGHGVLSELLDMLPSDARRCLVIAGPHTGGAAGRAVAALQQARRGEGGPRLDTVQLVTVPEGEAAKDLPVAAEGWRSAADAGLTRSDVIVGVGGGSVTDLAGFVAATWLRGIAVLQLPTTLLAMVDAAIGGKTGINTEAGKNLVGAFHPPTGVLCDLDTLATLPEAEIRSGLAEVAKCGFIADPSIGGLLAGLPDATASPDDGPIGTALRAHPALLADLVARAVHVKADVVGRDLREAGPREALNFGHTLGHAIERAEGYRRRHGEAIAIGMVFAAALGAAAGRAPQELIGRIRDELRRLGLPVTYPAGSLGQLTEAMRLDKKARASQLRFVIVPELGRTEILADPTEAQLRAAADEVQLGA